MSAYDPPRVLSTLPVDELAREAVVCFEYDGPVFSDLDLKERIEGIDGALEAIESISTR
jgi:hypothetical protein